MTPHKAALEANIKLRANHFLLDDEIDRVYQEEKIPDVFSKLTEKQMQAIVTELNEAKEINNREAEKLGLGIQDNLERSMYQHGVLNNKMLKSRRSIAKKYGIQAGDIATVEAHVMFLTTGEFPDKQESLDIFGTSL